MTVEEIYKKEKKDYEKAYKSIEIILDKELINAIDELVVLSVNMNLSLKELLSGKYDSLIETTIDVLFKDCGNNCESGLDCWNVLRQVEKEYITSAYNFVVAGRNL